MDYLVFARKYRPQQFSEIIGQDAVVQTLQNAFVKERLAQSFLFVGTRGVGKTSTARILAKALNCSGERAFAHESCGTCPSCLEITQGNSLDVLEIDGASNRGIDEIRNLRDNVKFKPLSGEYKVFIIDEVHMLTQEAFNALLKTLEEPPSHVKFVFATTEPHKIPQTILSRCQRYDFRHIQLNTILSTLENIAQNEKITCDQKALFLIAKNAQGSLRDACSLFDKVVSCLGETIVYEEVAQILGAVSMSVYFELLESIVERKAAMSLSILQREESSGKDLIHFTKGLVEVVRDVLVVCATGDAQQFVQLPDEDVTRLKSLSEKTNTKEFLYFFNILNTVHRQMRYSTFPKIDLEVALLKLVSREKLEDLSVILEKLNQMKGGSFLTQPSVVNRAASQPSERSISPSYPKQPNKTHAPSEELAVPTSGGSLGQTWQRVLQAVRKEKMLLGTYLSDGVPVSFENDLLLVAFPPTKQFSKESLDSQDNMRLMQDTLSNLFGKPTRIRLQVQGDATVSVSKKNDALDEVVQSAVEMFNGRIIERRGN